MKKSWNLLLNAGEKIHKCIQNICQESKDSYKEFLKIKNKIKLTLPPAYPKISADFNRNIKFQA